MSMRAFVGLSVPTEWIGPLVTAQGRVRGGNRVAPDDLHVTLAFLDDQPEQRLEALSDALSAKRLSAATLRPLAFAALGARKPRAVVLDLTPGADLTALRETVRNAARSAGIDLPRERFRPHVTLVRFPNSAPSETSDLPATISRLGVPSMPQAPVTGAMLWSSVLTPRGPIYEPLAAYPLRAA